MPAPANITGGRRRRHKGTKRGGRSTYSKLKSRGRKLITKGTRKARSFGKKMLNMFKNKIKM